MKNSSKYVRLFVLVLLLMVASLSNIALAQEVTKTENLKSRVSIDTGENQTKIWVTDFPKNTSVVIFDIDYNLISVVSTDDYGSAYINVNETIKNWIYAKTLNGEIIVTNKPIIKDGSDGKVAGRSNFFQKA